MPGIIGKKLGMSQIFDEAGAVVPVTVIEAGPCPVTQVRTTQRDGYQAVQLGFGQRKAVRASKAAVGHAAKAGLETAPEVLHEFAFGADESAEIGQTVTVERFVPGTRVKVTGTTRGRGFQGVVKRHGFGGGRASHGATRIHRAPGSIGAGTNPSRVIKGKRMPGHMGDKQQTVRNLQVARIDAERNLIYIRGAVPGAPNGYVYITQH